MRRRKMWKEKVYKTYRPYPVSIGDMDGDYSSRRETDSLSPSDNAGKFDNDKHFRDFFDKSSEDYPPFSKSIPSNDAEGFRPLHLLQSLFTDRLSFLQNALDELEKTKSEREQLASAALADLDRDIRDIERRLETLKAAVNNEEHKQHLEQKLFNLKREYRRESLLSWRDMAWLNNELRKLRKEIEALDRTTEPSKNREAPT